MKFRRTVKGAGIRRLKMPKQSPNLNAYAESFIRNIKLNCLDKMILFGERHLRYVIEQYVEHYHLERPHKGLDYSRPVEPERRPTLRDGPIACRKRLGGLLKSCHHEAA